MRPSPTSILIAAIVAATFAPFVLALRNRGWSRIKAAAAVFLGAAVVIIATLAVIAIAFLPYIAAVARRPSGEASPPLQAAARQPSRTSRRRSAIAIEPRHEGPAGLGVERGLSSDSSRTSDRSRPSPILATFLTFFFMMDGDKAWVWALSSANTWRREAIRRAGDVALERVGGYLRGTAVIAAFDGLVDGPLPGRSSACRSRRRWPSSSSSAGSSRTSAG